MQEKSTPKVQIARLDNSVVFKKLFRDPEILNEFLKDLLGLDLQLTADQIDTEKKFTPPVGNVDIAYDIEEILARIEETDNLDQLEAWMVRFATANSWQEIFTER